MKNIILLLTFLLSFSLIQAEDTVEAHEISPNVEQVIATKSSSNKQISFLKVYPVNDRKMNYLRVYPFSDNLVHLHFDVITPLNKGVIDDIKNHKVYAEIIIKDSNNEIRQQVDFRQNSYYQEASNFFGLYYIDTGSKFDDIMGDGNFDVKITIDGKVYSEGEFKFDDLEPADYVWSSI